jgi:hypothetical protein
MTILETAAARKAEADKIRESGLFADLAAPKTRKRLIDGQPPLRDDEDKRFVGFDAETGLATYLVRASAIGH